MFETMKDAKRLAEQLQAKHKPEVIRIAHLLTTAGGLCPFIGHNMHALIADCAESYCRENNIDIGSVSACAEDIQKTERTIAELVQLEANEMKSPQGQGVGEEFFKRFGNER